MQMVLHGTKEADRAAANGTLASSSDIEEVYEFEGATVVVVLDPSYYIGFFPGEDEDVPAPVLSATRFRRIRAAAPVTTGAAALYGVVEVLTRLF